MNMLTRERFLTAHYAGLASLKRHVSNLKSSFLLFAYFKKIYLYSWKSPTVIRQSYF